MFSNTDMEIYKYIKEVSILIIFTYTWTKLFLQNTNISAGVINRIYV